MDPVVIEARRRLVDVGGRTSEDLGLGRIFGQILVYLYLQPAACSLDQIGDDLGLSKASVSTSTRQLEALGLVRRVWVKGDRRNYFQTADNIVSAMQEGLLVFVGQRVRKVSTELDAAAEMLGDLGEDDESVVFMRKRLKRAQTLRDRVVGLLRTPLLKAFAKWS